MEGYRPPIQSKVEQVNLGQSIEFQDFVPMTGPGGGRNVLDYLTIRITGVITVADAGYNGRDVCKLIQLLDIQDRAGRSRWNLDGYESRIASLLYNGPERHTEHATIAIGAAAAVDFYLLIPFTKKNVFRGEDFALPADCFRKVTITWASLVGAATGSTTLSAPVLQAYITASCHEETSVELKSEDIVRSTVFSSSTQAAITAEGVVHDLAIIKKGTTAGGDVITAITDARVNDLGIPLLPRTDYVHAYRVRRDLGASGPTTPGTERYLDPVVEGKALPILASSRDTSVFDGKVCDNFRIDVGTGTTGLWALSRQVVTRSEILTKQQAARFHIRSSDGLRVKTAGKSQRELQGWNKSSRARLPVSAPLPTKVDR